MSTSPSPARLELEVELAERIRQLVAERGDSPAVRGPSGDLEPAWVQPECAALLHDVNEIRAGLGKDDLPIESIRIAEYRAATRHHVPGEGYELAFGRALAEMILDGGHDGA